MTILCLGALVVSLLTAFVIPFLPFACALMVAIAIGFTMAVIGGTPVVQACLSGLALLLTSQVGYGIGLALAALVSQRAAYGRRLGRAPPARPLRTENEPR